MDKLMKYGGMVLMAAGIIVVLSALPLVSQSVVSVGPISADVPQVSSQNYCWRCISLAWFLCI